MDIGARHIIHMKYVCTYSKYRYKYGYYNAIYPISIAIIVHLEKYKYGVGGGIV